MGNGKSLLMRSYVENEKHRGILITALIFLSYAYFILSCLTGIDSIFQRVRIIIILLLIIAGAFHVLTKGKIYWIVYLCWSLSFLFILLAAMLYSPQLDLAWNGIYTYIKIFIPVYIIMQTIVNINDLDRFMNMILYSGLILSFIIIIFYKDELFIADRFYSLGNPNSIMASLLHPVCILIYRIITKKNNKTINILYLVICLIVIFFTGSRKGIVIPLVFTIMFIILNNKRTLVKRIVITGIVTFIIYYIIFNVEELYIVLGTRLEIFLTTLFDSKNVTYFSDAIRIQYIKDSFAMFKQSPLLGYGVNAFEANYGFYSHNNYTEILCSVGIVGFCAFYWIHAYCLWNLFKARKINSNTKNYCDFAISLIIANLTFDWGGVSYNTLLTMVTIPIAVSPLIILK